MSQVRYTQGNTAYLRQRGEDTHFNDGKLSDIHSNMYKEPDWELIYWMQDLFHVGTKKANNTTGKLAFMMLNKFLTKQGGTFQNSDLNNEILNDPTFTDYINKFNEQFKKTLSSVGGNINKMPVLSTPGPQFSWSHTLTGLAITIDAFNYTQITLNNFTLDNKGNYKGSISLYMEDAFGLDKNDVSTKGWIHPGFEAWWLLQHTRGYIPLKTIVQISTTIFGNINSP